MSDARALNNLGVLRARGAGVERDPAEARRLFARAAEQGSGRARLNAVMMERGGCGVNTDRAAATAVALGQIAEADPIAANLIHDCLYFDATSGPLPDRSDRALSAESASPQPRDGNALLHAGWAMMNLARTTTIPDYSDEDETRRYEAKVVPIARKAMELLFAATEAGAPAAYEGLGILSMQFGDKLGDDPMAVRLRERDNWEWLEVGAEKGDWGLQCRVADARITHLRYDGRPYTRDEFNAVVAFARQCTERKEVRNEPAWFEQAEWLVVMPRYYLQSRPILEIDATAAALNGLLFFDADRKMNAAEGSR
jgi:TPR repeat protein